MTTDSVPLEKYEEVVEKYAKLTIEYMDTLQKMVETHRYVQHINYAMWMYVTKYGSKVSVPKYLLESDSEFTCSIRYYEELGNVCSEVEILMHDEES